MAVRATKLTPEIKAQVDKWIEWLETMHHARFHPATDILFKAKVVVETGHCPCKVERKCPCNEVMEELRRDGQCFCHVFCTKKWAQEHGYTDGPNAVHGD
jgi:hypothetical protein